MFAFAMQCLMRKEHLAQQGSPVFFCVQVKQLHKLLSRAACVLCVNNDRLGCWQTPRVRRGGAKVIARKLRTGVFSAARALAQDVSRVGPEWNHFTTVQFSVRAELAPSFLSFFCLLLSWECHEFYLHSAAQLVN